MSGVATAIGGSALLGAYAANSAAHTQADAAGAASNNQLAMWEIQNGQEAPWRQAGTQALNEISANTPLWNQPFTADDFHANMDPAYGFDVAQGQKAIQTSDASSRGLVNAGTLASLSNYSQSQASNEYQNAFNRYQTQINSSYNRLAGIAGLGQTAQGQSNQAAQNAGNNISANTIGAGNAMAAGTVGVANAFGNAASQGIGAYQYGNLISAINGRNGGTAADLSNDGVHFNVDPGITGEQYSMDSRGNVESGLYGLSN